jgi:hypothetical protein
LLPLPPPDNIIRHLTFYQEIKRMNQHTLCRHQLVSFSKFLCAKQFNNLETELIADRLDISRDCKIIQSQIHEKGRFSLHLQKLGVEQIKK